MRIALVDVDNWSKLQNCFPNIPLMKLAAYHKNVGDSVEWYDPTKHYDIAYISKRQGISAILFDAIECLPITHLCFFE